MRADRGDARLVFIDVVDANGTVVPTDSRQVTLSVSGPASIVGPTTVAMKGGQLATWVRPTADRGDHHPHRQRERHHLRQRDPDRAGRGRPAPRAGRPTLSRGGEQRFARDQGGDGLSQPRGRVAHAPAQLEQAGQRRGLCEEPDQHPPAPNRAAVVEGTG